MLQNEMGPYQPHQWASQMEENSPYLFKMVVWFIGSYYRKSYQDNLTNVVSMWWRNPNCKGSLEDLFRRGIEEKCPHCTSYISSFSGVLMFAIYQISHPTKRSHITTGRGILITFILWDIQCVLRAIGFLFLTIVCVPFVVPAIDTALSMAWPPLFLTSSPCFAQETLKLH